MAMKKPRNTGSAKRPRRGRPAKKIKEGPKALPKPPGKKRKTRRNPHGL